MTITRRHLPPPKIKLQPANLYVDDIEEILSILKPDGEPVEPPPRLQFTIDDQECDSLEDLLKVGEKKAGGRVHHFEMSLRWNTDYIYDYLYVYRHRRARLEVGGSTQRQTLLGIRFKVCSSAGRVCPGGFAGCCLVASSCCSWPVFHSSSG